MTRIVIDGARLRLVYSSEAPITSEEIAQIFWLILRMASAHSLCE